jgi:hypothetical protein
MKSKLIEDQSFGLRKLFYYVVFRAAYDTESLFSLHYEKKFTKLMSFGIN